VTDRAPVAEEIPAVLAGERLDRVVAMLTGLPRAEVSGLVDAGRVRLSGQVVTTRSRKVRAGDVVEIDVPVAEDARPGPDPGVDVPVVYEDADIVVVDKPAGLVVHPGAGHAAGTLVNGLLARYPDMAAAGDPARPGIVHRLDRGTSGLLVAARTPAAHGGLVEMMAGRRVERRYLALVGGEVASPAGVVDAPVGRSARHPTRMTVSVAGRPARTRYEVRERLPGPATLLECSLETGRTHQIRVHLAAIGHPVAGDPTYGGLPLSARPFLHAHALAFDHPVTGQRLSFASPLPDDLEQVLARLRTGL
jgi:23S rRNA pseudouridine1911/1915/1917 synthase